LEESGGVMRMTKEQEDAIYTAYLGIWILEGISRKIGLDSLTMRSAAVLEKLSEIFPFVAEQEKGWRP
jgi:hypothetical protein